MPSSPTSVRHILQIPRHGGLGLRAAHLGFLLFSSLPTLTLRADQGPSPADLNRMDVEDLMAVKVTSVSKKEQSLSRTAAAVFVIDQEDIRRSGATSIPDLLRMVPGVDVQQVDANAAAISVRGFNTRFSNKLLVLIDGRTVYTPVFSGVFWEDLDMPLEDIDRIEVIRGPGATVWGANAVNGVISIFTKSSAQTKGGLVTAGGGSQTHALGLVQYGGTAGKAGAYRVYGKFFDIGNSVAYDRSPAADHWRREHAGFRSDWDLSRRDSLMVQGDLFANQASQTRREGFFATPRDVIFNQGLDAAGGDVLLRWNHTLAGGSQTSFQAYYDSYRRTDLGIPDKLSTFDLDFQHHFSAGDRSDIVWGLGYRVNKSTIPPGYATGFSPDSRTDNLYSGFAQNEVRLSDSLWVTLGCKLEHNAYTGLEVEPSARFAWSRPGSRNTVWASASRAFRQPSRVDSDLRADPQAVAVLPDMLQVSRMHGNPRLKDEELRDYELGYRAEFTKTFSLDAATFLSFYRNLQTIEPQPAIMTPGSPVQIEIPLRFENKSYGLTYGGELSLSWNVTSRWRVRPGYAYLHAAIRQDPSSRGAHVFNVPTAFPQNMLQVRSSLNLSRRTEFDQSLYYTVRQPGASIPGHARFDLRLARRFGESAEVSLVGQNLLRPRAIEYGDALWIVGTQAVRSIYGQITWRF